jgi:hypothetical protein
MSIDVAILADINVINEEGEKMVKCRLYNRNTGHLEYKNKVIQVIIEAL